MMKKIFLYFFCLSTLLASCNADDFSSSGDLPYDVNPTIVGTWTVTKYEAVDENDAVMKSTADQFVIRSTYWKFSFSSTALMSLWYGNSDSPVASINFYYQSGELYFGDAGYAEVESLTDDALVFISDSFMPSGWESEKDIKYVRTICKKS